MLYESLWTVEIRGSDRYEHADVPQRLQQASETAANACALCWQIISTTELQNPVCIQVLFFLRGKLKKIFPLERK